MENMKHILPGEGFGSLRFGMNRFQVRAALGEPDEIERDEESEDLEYWHYDELDLSLTFDELEEWRLTTIVSADDEIELFGVLIKALNREELLDILKKHGASEIHTEVVESGEESLEIVEAEEFEMLIWLEGGAITEVQWGPYFSDEDTINWPAELNLN